MHRTLALRVCMLAACLAAVSAAATPERAIAEAEHEMARVQELVDAGVAPRKQLEEVAAQLDEARDEAVLASTLYAQLDVSQFTPELSAQMISAADRRIARRQKAIDEAQIKAEEGVLARTALTPLLEDLDRARRTRDEAEMRAQLFEELAEAAQSEAQVAEAGEDVNAEILPAAIRYDGKGMFNDSYWRKVVLAFEKEFHHGLRVSAKGDTLYHRSLGFDHRGRIDVAIDPDSKEGLWLRQYLEAQQIPYFAYRRAVAGQASAAHIHLGPPSPHWQS